VQLISQRRKKIVREKKAETSCRKRKEKELGQSTNKKKKKTNSLPIEMKFLFILPKA
jgi:hypothetical protein